ncbi:MAG: hypothetical protein A2827_01310 [Candidatus Spechtbacteria bacterium RIFCSPHIGHO2_01_FULL_43_30]|uniref:ATPase BadF/BadG/BcrA/BcrD type domain-containing protein n=1 Tax=Candidatus Spechtbacteria bacterium RIFCSPHIGHO2_01_FULL_43_30 TaxID=1802158 RepID=A0A1G2H6D4_9BACT|nr:MAG: hypothetical protein A2827_01310 [Candidatus Spechtbacteria bacterium RIFCSPHIGHO2_01_FULL_43_30]
MNKQESLYLGVEGGATKSTAFLSDRNLNIIGENTGSALNYHSLKKDTIRKNLENLLNPLIEKSSGSKIKAVFGLAGVDSIQDEKFYSELIERILANDCVFKVVNDSKVAIEARCHGAKDRIVVIAGTGSNAYGENAAGDHFNTMWWDHIMGDEGSGYYFGLKALQSAARSFDGRIPKTELEDLVMKTESAKSIHDFYPVFYEKLSKSESPKAYVASFAPLIDRALEKRDEEAIRIRDDGARELALGASTVAKKLGFIGKEFCLGVVGSQWKMPGLFEAFQKEVLEKFPDARFSKSENPGAWGAMLMAQEL